MCQMPLTKSSFALANTTRYNNHGLATRRVSPSLTAGSGLKLVIGFLQVDLLGVSPSLTAGSGLKLLAAGS